MTFRGVQLAASFTLLATTASLTLLPIAAHGSKAEPTVNVERVNGLITVEASVSAPVDARLAWQVLTDYEHLADFIPGMHKSGVVSTGSEPIRVEQLGEGGFLFYHFPIEIVLQMDETPFESIRFHAVGGNIEQMEGVWRLEGSAPVHVRYRARMKPAILGAAADRAGRHSPRCAAAARRPGARDGAACSAFVIIAFVAVIPPDRSRLSFSCISLQKSPASEKTIGQ